MPAYPPDTVIIRRSKAGWSAYNYDEASGTRTDDEALIASADMNAAELGGLIEYVLTLEPRQVVIDPAPYTRHWHSSWPSPARRG